MAIQTEDGNHSFNIDELLTYLAREQQNRHDLTIANLRNPERADREREMERHYSNMYKAVLFYRKETP